MDAPITRSATCAKEMEWGVFIELRALWGVSQSGFSSFLFQPGNRSVFDRRVLSDLGGRGQPLALSQRMRATVGRWTGIPIL